MSGNSRCAASADFSPSHSSTTASGACASRFSPYSGLGLSGALVCQPVLPSSTPKVSGKNCFALSLFASTRRT